MALYLVDLPLAPLALSLAKEDPEAKVVLIQDGVYFRTFPQEEVKTYALKEDVEKRGLKPHLPPSITPIDYHQLMDLVLEEEKVFNFL